MKTYLIKKNKYRYSLLGLLCLLFSQTLMANGSFKGVTQVDGTEFEVGEEFVVSYKLAAKGSYSLSNPKFGLSGAKFEGLEGHAKSVELRIRRK